MLVYVVVTTLPDSKQSVATNWVAVAFIILYEVVFAFGWLGTCWIYGPEIAPLKYRHVAGSLGAAGEWFSTWVMVFGGGTGISAVGPIIFIWPLLCCFLAAAYVYYLCPESKLIICRYFARNLLTAYSDRQNFGRARYPLCTDSRSS